MARRKQTSFTDQDILNTIVQTYFELGQFTSQTVREILINHGVPPRGMIDLLGITSSEIRQNIKQKYDLLDRKNSQGSSDEIYALIEVLKSSANQGDGV